MKKEKELTGIESDRIGYLDTLRVIALFGIIILHLSAVKWYSTDINSFEWNVFNIYDSCVRCMVPIFVMISGALCLSKKYTLKHIYGKKILRLVISFAFWSLLYALILYYDEGIKTIVTQTIQGHFHLWFIFMIIQLYMLIPVLKKITENEKIMEYFLILFFVFQIIIPQIVAALNTANQSWVANIINTNYNKLQLLFGYSGYFVLGYYLSNKDFTKIQRKIIYILGILGAILTISLSIIESNRLGAPKSTYYNYFSLNVFISAIALFVFSKYNFKGNKVVKYISQDCFGIYLIHILTYKLLFKICNIDTLSFNPILSIPAFAVLVFAISFLISTTIRRVPILNKYII